MRGRLECRGRHREWWDTIKVSRHNESKANVPSKTPSETPVPRDYSSALKQVGLSVGSSFFFLLVPAKCVSFFLSMRRPTLIARFSLLFSTYLPFLFCFSA